MFKHGKGIAHRDTICSSSQDRRLDISPLMLCCGLYVLMTTDDHNQIERIALHTRYLKIPIATNWYN